MEKAFVSGLIRVCVWFLALHCVIMCVCASLCVWFIGLQCQKVHKFSPINFLVESWEPFERVCVCQCCILLISSPVESRTFHICKLWQHSQQTPSSLKGQEGHFLIYHGQANGCLYATILCNYGDSVLYLGTESRPEWTEVSEPDAVHLTSNIKA